MRLFIFLVFILLSGIMSAQIDLSKKIDFSFQEGNLEVALIQLSEQEGFVLAYNKQLFQSRESVNFNFENISLEQVLNNLLAQKEIGFEVIGNQLVLFRTADYKAKSFTISGYVEDAETGERLYGANIYDFLSGKGISTNAYGFFSLTLYEGSVRLIISYLGYEQKVINLELTKDEFLNAELKVSLTLNAVVVKAEIANKEGKSESEYIDFKRLNSLPSLTGEPDLVQTVLDMPGVQSGANGVGGLYVRGGGTDQNLVMLDDAPVYNPLHTWGVFSIFNTSAIQSAQLIKSGFSAKHGGRLSSIFDIRTKEGNNKKFGAEGSLGLFSVKASVEGPIVKEKASFFASGRRSLLDFYSVPYYREQRQKEGINGSIEYYFYDYNFKLNFKTSKKDRFYLSYYTGKDIFKDDHLEIKQQSDTVATYNKVLNQNWGNEIASARWNRMIGNKLFANTSLTYSKYAYESKELVDFDSYNSMGVLNEYRSLRQYNSNIASWNGKVDFDYYLSSNQQLKFGLGANKYSFKPGAVSISTEDFRDSVAVDLQYIESLDTFWQNDKLESYEYSFYVEDQLKISDKWKVNIGLHTAIFNVDSVYYRSLQPRALLEWKPNSKLAFFAAYDRMVQHIHLLSASSIGLPEDIWVSASEGAKPLKSSQFTAGLIAKYKYGLDFRLEYYSKQMDNLVEFLEDRVFLVNATNWENAVVSGSGNARGVELDVKKELNNGQVWLNYSYAFSNRSFPEIRNDTFPFQYDRRHVLNLGATKQLGNNWEVSAAFVYATGIAVTLPVGKYQTIIDGGLPPIQVYIYSSKNNERLPDYHHLDLSARYQWETGKAQHFLQFGISNIYFQKNTIYYELGNGEQAYHRFIPPLFPSLSYNLKI